MEPTRELLHEKKNYLKLNILTSLLEKKKKDSIPYIFPVARIHTNSFKNISEKNRFEKITDFFLKLRVHLFENPENELIIAKEFFIKHGIYNINLFTFEKLSNFINFIKSEDCVKFHPSKSLKEIILEVVNLPYDKYIDYLMMNNINNNDNYNENYNDNDNNNNYDIDNNEFDGMMINMEMENIDNLNINTCNEFADYNNNNIDENNCNENNDNQNCYNSTNNSKDISPQKCDIQISAHLLTDNYYNKNNNHLNTYNTNINIDANNNLVDNLFTEKDLLNYKTNHLLSHLNKYQYFENTPNFINRTNTNFFANPKNKIRNYKSLNEDVFNLNTNATKQNFNTNTNNTNAHGYIQNTTKFIQNNINNTHNTFYQKNKKITKNPPQSSSSPIVNKCVRQNEKEDILLCQTKYKYHRGGNPVLNEKIYKVEYNNPKFIIEYLEPEIEKIKKSREEIIAKNNKNFNFNINLIERNYEKSLDRIKKPQKYLEKFIISSGQLPLKDLEYIKRKNKLLEYIILQRSKNRYRLEDEKKVFDMDYGNKFPSKKETEKFNKSMTKSKTGGSYNGRESGTINQTNYNMNENSIMEF